MVSKIIVLLFIITIYCDFSDCESTNLTCYSCFDTGAHPDCWDTFQLRESASNNDSKLTRRCASNMDYNETYCIIQRVVQGGTVQSLIRDCIDFKQFSEDGLKGRLKNLHADNTTICSYNALSGKMMCVSVCNSNFCNGPIAASKPLNSNFITIFVLYFVFLYLL